MYTEVHLKDSKFVLSKNIKCFETKLPDNIFIRIHQSYMINIERMRNISLNDKSKIITDTGIELPVSKKYKNNLKLVLENSFISI